jgi:multidrug resistance protein, MATE family
MVSLKNYFKGYNDPGGIGELLLIAIPMVISTACDGVMTFTDRLFLSRIGSEQMNAALGGGIALQMLTFFFLGLIGYSTALVAQYFGAKEKSNTSKAAFQAVLIAIVAWPVILLLKPLTVNYFHLMHIPESQLGYQTQYLSVLAWGSIFSLLRQSISCYFSGIGKTRIVMTATLAAMIVNVFLDYILIFGKLGFNQMGVTGAALATVTGSFVAVIILVVSYLSNENRIGFEVMKSFRFNRTIMKKLIHFGYPAGFEMFLNFLAFSVMVSLFQAKGDAESTATTIMFNWDLVSFIPLLGIEIAVTSLVGRYMGAEKPKVAQHAAISAIKTGIFYSFIILLLFICIPEPLARVFHPASDSGLFERSVPIAVTMIRIATLYVLAEAVMAAVIGALRGAGDTKFTMIASVSLHWLLVPVLFITLNLLNLSVIMGWLFLVILYLLFCLVIIQRFRKGRWKMIKVIH